LKILIANILPTNDITSWSGISKNIYQQLSKDNSVVYCYSPLAHKLQQVLSYLSFYRHRFFGTRNNVYFNTWVARIYARSLRKSANLFKPNLILSIGSGTELYAYTPRCKAYLVADANFHLLHNQYRAYTNLSDSGVRSATKVEKAAFAKFYTLYFTSDWALKSTTEHYLALSSKLKRINFGSNIPGNSFVENDLPESLIAVELLTIGVDYHRKGIDLTENLAQSLGCTLSVVGIDIKLSKENEEELIALKDAYTNAHFFVLLSRADCTPIVINEANSFGLPVIATKIGGIPSLIKNGVNGYLVDSPEEAAVIVKKLVADQTAYQLLRKSTFAYYSDNLTWQNFEKRLLAEFK
jgi:glycosyltransferase involved in cell wall biosynthesis